MYGRNDGLALVLIIRIHIESKLWKMNYYSEMSSLNNVIGKLRENDARKETQQTPDL